MNPLDQYPGVRKALYILQWVTTGITGTAGVVLTALGESPAWFVIASAALAYVWSYTGVTAQANVTPAPQHRKD